MIPKIYLLVPALLLVFLLQCSSSVTAPQEKKEIELNKKALQVIEANNRFGWKLFRSLTEAETDQNVFISPLSISLALGMALNGAAGETRQAMETTLELSGLSQKAINQYYRQIIDFLLERDPQVILNIANSIWYRQELTVKQTFIDLNQRYFDALVKGVDFSAPTTVNQINQWVKEQTRGKISRGIDRIKPEDVMFLINAIYFKGTWTTQFNPKLTREKPFSLPDGGKTTCQMMQLSDKLPYLETDDFQMVELPYGDKHFSALVILPRPGKSPGELINRLNAETLQEWVEQLQLREGTLELPKFELRYGKTLNQVLSKLGMAVAFRPGEADFSQMYEGPEKLYLSLVNHGTYVKVDEEGTEAAAVTSISISITSIGPQKPFYMRVDRPFLFLIREKDSGALLFMGQIVEPKWPEN